MGKRSHSHIIVVTKQVLTRIKNDHGVGATFCYHCRKLFHIGERVVSHKNSRSGRRKYYHVECWHGTYVA